MIGGTVIVKGKPLSAVTNTLRNYDDRLQAYIERVALLARGLIAERLETHIGTGAEHFNVSIRPNSVLGYTVTVGPSDEVGVFLMEGVEPHVIESSGSPMPIGNGQVVSVVHHPGFASKRDLIMKAVYEGMAAALELA